MSLDFCFRTALLLFFSRSRVSLFVFLSFLFAFAALRKTVVALGDALVASFFFVFARDGGGRMPHRLLSSMCSMGICIHLLENNYCLVGHSPDGASKKKDPMQAYRGTKLFEGVRFGPFF